MSASHRCHLFEVAFVWELTEETIHLPLSCLQGGVGVQVLPAALPGKPPLTCSSLPARSTLGAIDPTL